MGFDKTLAKSIYDKHYKQTIEDVISLRNKYKNTVCFKNTKMIDLLDKLKSIYDITDHILYDVNQYIHSLQCYEMMKKNGVTDKEMLILAFIHDIGKIWANELKEDPSNVFCCNNLIPSNYSIKCGLDNLYFNFGHDEIAYIKLKKYVSKKVAFVLRYHSCRLVKPNNIQFEKIKKYVSNEDYNNLLFLEQFLKYDLNSKRRNYIPSIDKNEIRELIESYFPNVLYI